MGMVERKQLKETVSLSGNAKPSRRLKTKMKVCSKENLLPGLRPYFDWPAKKGEEERLNNGWRRRRGQKAISSTCAIKDWSARKRQEKWGKCQEKGRPYVTHPTVRKEAELKKELQFHMFCGSAN